MATTFLSPWVAVTTAPGTGSPLKVTWPWYSAACAMPSPSTSPAAQSHTTAHRRSRGLTRRRNPISLTASCSSCADQGSVQALNVFRLQLQAAADKFCPIPDGSAGRREALPFRSYLTTESRAGEDAFVFITG